MSERVPTLARHVHLALFSDVDSREVFYSIHGHMSFESPSFSDAGGEKKNSAVAKGGQPLLSGSREEAVGRWATLRAP